MNRIFTLLLAICSFLPISITAQTYLPGLVANFGVEGDLLSGTRQSGSFSPQDTHDWFLKTGGAANAGKGIIDTTGNSAIAARLALGENFSFNREMKYSKYSIVDGLLLLDGQYGRDNFALSSTGVTSDKTAYQGGQKNGDNPSIWATFPIGSAVADKADIIDGYVHFRRNGSIINGTSSSHLIALFGLSTLANNGDRYMDIEFFASRINYDTTSGAFSNSGSATTGGHSNWIFNADGSIRKFGDMTISFAFNSSSVSEISVWLWVSRTDYDNLNPRDFDFIPGEFNGATNGADYGYVKIQPNTGNSTSVWAASNVVSTSGPNWGTANKTLGSNSNNYYYSSYSVGQFAEGGVNLSQLGIDPAYLVGGDPCAPAFTRVMFKSRSSASFTSSLQDFIGPYSFLDAPQVSSSIAPPAPLKCNKLTTTLSPAAITSGAYYQWTTTNGNILTNPNSPTITVDKVGTYYLSASIIAGCIPAIDSAVVTSDYYQPIASAYTVGTIDPLDPTSTANIWGGDVALSNFATPFGGSAGLDWNWKGPNGYTSTVRNNQVSTIGTYTLTLTESRNGCKDTAYTPVPMKAMALPVVIKDFSAVKQDNDKVAVKWLLAEDEPKDVELMRSFDGKEFTTITHAMSFGNFNTDYTKFNDDVKVRSSNTVYYRLKITENSGALVYSRVIAVKFGEIKVQKLTAAPNPARTYTVVSITNDQSATATIQIVSMNGTIMQQKKVNVEKGTNQFIMNDIDRLQNGMYIIRAVVNGEMFTQKLLKTE